LHSRSTQKAKEVTHSGAFTDRFYLFSLLATPVMVIGGFACAGLPQPVNGGAMHPDTPHA
jgi:hypothetical protein